MKSAFLYLVLYVLFPPMFIKITHIYHISVLCYILTDFYIFILGALIYDRFFLYAATSRTHIPFPFLASSIFSCFCFLRLPFFSSALDKARLEKKHAGNCYLLLAYSFQHLRLSHSVWMYFTGTTSLIKLLPLHLCGLQSLFIPLSIFTPFTCFKDFVYATSLLGGIFGTVFPAGIADYYPMFSFQTIQTFVLHGLLIYVPLALIVSGAHRPSLHHFPRVLCIFLFVVFIVGYIDFQFGENYMFLYEAPSGTPLVWIFDTFGRQTYLLVSFLLLAGISFCIHLPFAHTHRTASLKAHHHI